MGRKTPKNGLNWDKLQWRIEGVALLATATTDEQRQEIAEKYGLARPKTQDEHRREILAKYLKVSHAKPKRNL